MSFDVVEQLENALRQKLSTLASTIVNAINQSIGSILQTKIDTQHL